MCKCVPLHMRWMWTF